MNDKLLVLRFIFYLFVKQLLLNRKNIMIQQWLLRFSIGSNVVKDMMIFVFKEFLTLCFPCIEIFNVSFQSILRILLTFPVDLRLMLVDLRVVKFIFFVFNVVYKLMVFFKPIVQDFCRLIQLIECWTNIVPSTILHGKSVALSVEPFLFSIEAMVFDVMHPDDRLNIFNVKMFNLFYDHRLQAQFL